MHFTRALWFRSVLDVVKSSFRHSPARRRRHGRLRLPVEALEDRCLLSFSAPVSLLGGTSADGTSTVLAAADVNHDGRADLINVDNFGGTHVYLGQKNGHWDRGATGGLNVDLTPNAVAVGDINGDGNVDIVVAETYYSGGWGDSGYISILRGDGTGYFSRAVDFNIGLFPESVAVGDVNGDGKLDIVTGGNRVEVLLNSDSTIQALNSGTVGYPWLPRQSYELTGFSIALGDVNGDGSLDIVTDNGILVNAGDGSGAFANLGTGPVFNPTPGRGPLRVPIALGDINGDGHLDIVGGNGDGNAAVSVALNNGDGTFAAIESFASTDPNSVALADFNGDGKLDIAVTGEELDVLLNNGDGTFGPAQKVGPAGQSLVAADFNGDGFVDLSQIDGAMPSSYPGTATIDVFFNNADWQGSGHHGKGHNK